MNKYRKKVGLRKGFIKKSIIPVKKLEVNKQVVIFSNRRSGSTLLMEILASMPETATLWEPLHPSKGVVTEELFKSSVISNIEKDKKITSLFKQIITGNISNNWVTQYSTLLDYITAKRFVVKFVRANSLMPWFVNNYDLNIKPIYLLRHPVAAAVSNTKTLNLKTFELSKYELFQYSAKKLADFNFYLSSLNTKLEKLVALWCISNSKPLSSKYHKKKWRLILYENLLKQKVSTMNKVFTDFEEIPDEAWNVLKKPSKSDFKQGYTSNVNTQIEKWENVITDEDRKNVQKILNDFDIELYNVESSYPQV